MAACWMSRATGRRGRVISLLVGCLTVSVLPLAASAQLPDPALTLTVDDDGMQCFASFTSIQAAVDVAPSGSTIVVCDGTYVEQVVINNKTLTLQASADPTQHAIVQAPLMMTDPKAIIRVTGPLAMNVTIDGFIITGPGPGGCGSIESGIRVDGGAAATIEHNLIQHIRDDPFSGCQNGIGIRVGRQSDNTIGMASIDENTIEDYQKGGIVVDGVVAGISSTAVITNNIVTGAGRTEIIGQNGIQVSRGAMVPPTNLHGNTVMGNFYWNRSATTIPAVATGVLYFHAGEPGYEGPINSTNKIRHNQVNVSVIP